MAVTEERLEAILVNSLENTLNVLICSESSQTIAAINSVLDRYTPLNLFRARSLEAMASHWAQVSSFNCVVVDAKCTFGREAISKVAKVPFWTPVLILGDSPDSMPFIREPHRSSSVPDGITYISLSDIKQFAQAVIESSIRKRLIDQYPDELALAALSALFEKHPLSVDDWALLINITSRKFQRLFKPYSDLSPKKIISLYHVFRIVFDILEKRHSQFPQESPCESDMNFRVRVMEYVLTRRKELLY